MSNPVNETLGLVYVGVGGHWEKSHESFLSQTGLCTVEGVADEDPVRLRAAQETYGLPDEAVTKDYHDFLDRDAVRSVVIATGDATHYQIARDALEAGKHVLVEKPAAATIEECVELPELFAFANKQSLRFWVCHPREFGSGPWQKAAHLIRNPEQISREFGVGPMGKLIEMRYDCLYTLPDDKKALHASFADDKLNHTVVSVMRSLPLIGFRDAVLQDNTDTSYDARMVTVSGYDDSDGVVVRASGRRTGHREYHDGGVYRDWAEIIFEEGVVQVEPSLGTIGLIYGNKPKEPLEFDPSKLYDDMFGAFNSEFLRCVLDPKRAEPLSTRTKLLGTAAALLMQQPGFDGEITEQALRAWGNRLG